MSSSYPIRYTVRMKEYTYRTISGADFHPLLRELPDPPDELWIAGSLPPADYKMLCIVGARAYSSYGHEVCTTLIEGLQGLPICIVSGLARGIDSVAHEAALKLGLLTVAFPGSGLSQEVLYPTQNRELAERIVGSGGALLSEYAPDFRAQDWTFPRRNRLMAGISDVTLIIEGTSRSGTNITARLALDYNRTVCAVPGSIFSPLSKAPHELIRQGAIPVTCPKDIIEALGLSQTETQIPFAFDSDTNEPP
jgi:DNA processing protein